MGFLQRVDGRESAKFLVRYAAAMQSRCAIDRPQSSRAADGAGADAEALAERRGEIGGTAVARSFGRLRL